MQQQCAQLAQNEFLWDLHTLNREISANNSKSNSSQLVSSLFFLQLRLLLLRFPLHFLLILTPRHFHKALAYCFAILLPYNLHLHNSHFYDTRLIFLFFLIVSCLENCEKKTASLIANCSPVKHSENQRVYPLSNTL